MRRQDLIRNWASPAVLLCRLLPHSGPRRHEDSGCADRTMRTRGTLGGTGQVIHPAARMTVPTQPASIPLVLVHGLWDEPRLFRRLEERLAGRRQDLFVPHLPHRLGAIPLLVLAERLGALVDERYGPSAPIDLLGFSMGGVIGRLWVQMLGGHWRTRRFYSVASPHNGTFTAQPWPSWLLAGIADMKRGSPLLRRLNDDLSTLEGVECHSYYGRFDHMVVPASSCMLPVGRTTLLPVWNHRNLILAPRALDPLVEDLLRP